ncbi:uncharacterized protein LOC130692161 [Daphnia carinata]|uniref:uncharacterized protein LOC130692161 n=1 Tax=Daphnia carinata TaxID=120202 RepID=UPI00257A53F5|nr:uncharacterized protein LOC130692161 [Daphnia carinata]
MSCAESSDGERTMSPTAAATVRERRRLRMLKRRWNHGANNNNNNNNGGMVLSFSAFRRARRMRNQRRMTKEEYLRLKNMVPAVATQPRVSKVQVIEEAIKYIDSLHVALFQRLRAQELACAADPSNTISSRGQAQVTGNESDIQPEPSQLSRWIGNVLPTPHALTTAHLLVTERQQQRDGIKQWPFFMGKVDCLIRKKQS